MQEKELEADIKALLAENQALQNHVVATLPEPEYGVVLTRASDIRIEPVTWLWPDMIPQGMFTLLGRTGRNRQDHHRPERGSHCFKRRKIPGWIIVPSGQCPDMVSGRQSTTYHRPAIECGRCRSGQRLHHFRLS